MDPVVSVTPVVTPAAPVTATPTPPGEVPPPQYATLEQFNTVLSRLEGISGKISGLERTKPATPVTPTPDPTLIERVKSIEDRDKAQREREKLTVISDALKAGGVPAAKASREARLILMDHGDKIQVDDKFNVVYRESEDKASPANEWIGAYLKTDEGKTLIPPKGTIDAGGGGNGSATVTRAAHPMLSMTYKQIMEGRSDLRASFFREHPEEFAAKEKAHFNK